MAEKVIKIMILQDDDGEWGLVLVPPDARSEDDWLWLTLDDASAIMGIIDELFHRAQESSSKVRIK